MALLVIYFATKSILSDTTMDIPTYFWLIFVWYSLSNHRIFNISVLFCFRYVFSYKQHNLEEVFFKIQAADHCFLTREWVIIKLLWLQTIWIHFSSYFMLFLCSNFSFVFSFHLFLNFFCPLNEYSSLFYFSPLLWSAVWSCQIAVHCPRDLPTDHCFCSLEPSTSPLNSTPTGLGYVCLDSCHVCITAILGSWRNIWLHFHLDG